MLQNGDEDGFEGINPVAITVASEGIRPKELLIPVIRARFRLEEENGWVGESESEIGVRVGVGVACCRELCCCHGFIGFIYLFMSIELN